MSMNRNEERSLIGAAAPAPVNSRHAPPASQPARAGSESEAQAQRPESGRSIAAPEVLELSDPGRRPGSAAQSRVTSHESRHGHGDRP